MLAVGIAQYLESLGLVDFDEDGFAGNTFIGVVPAEPEMALTITGYGGPEPDGRLGYDSPNIQLRARDGSRHPVPAYDWLMDIYGVLHGMGGVTLPDGTYVVSCYAIQSAPTWIGTDENGRHEYTQNYQFHTRNHTQHRE